MEALVILKYSPEEVAAIEQLVASRNSFVALLDGNLYSLINYLNPLSEVSEFSAMLDRNIYTRITSLVKGGRISEQDLASMRWASATLAFCQIAGITFDYASSLYEYASVKGGAGALGDMRRFRIADNSNPQLFIDFALGPIAAIPKKALAKPLAPAEIPAPQEFEKRLRYFRIHYTFILKIAEIGNCHISGVEKMLRFLDWMYSGFFFSQPALIFANRYFSPNPCKGMIKGISKRDLQNAAWDMMLVQDWRKRALNKLEANQPVLLITGDRAVRDMASQVMTESEETALEYFRGVWGRHTGNGKRIFERYSKLWGQVTTQSDEARRRPVYEAQMEIMRNLEKSVFKK